MGFEMDQETSGVVPVCRFVFQMNFDSVVVCSYLWLLKDNLCFEYRWQPDINLTGLARPLFQSVN